MSTWQILVALLAGHALCDYPLQGDWLSKAKNPTLTLVPGATIWPMALTSHALIQAAMVQIVTGSWILASVEFVAHWLIDYAKCRGAFGYNADQWLHVACKAAYVGAIFALGSIA